MHPSREITSLGIGRADLLRIRVTLNPRLTSTDAVGGAVAPLEALWRGTVELDEHGVVNMTHAIS
jgi:hypothetical protein